MAFEFGLRMFSPSQKGHINAELPGMCVCLPSILTMNICTEASSQRFSFRLFSPSNLERNKG